MIKCRLNNAYIAPFPLSERVFEYPLRNQQIGIGGMARVSVKEMAGREIAIKKAISTGAGTLDGIFKQQIKRESVLLTRLAHPNIAKVYGSWRIDGTWRYTMKRYKGDLFALLAESRRISKGRSLYIVREIAKALSYLHDLHIVHVEVKPGNILLGDYFEKSSLPEVVLADFGNARHVGGHVREDKGNPFFGTPGYIHPDRLATGRSPEMRDDVYGLLITLFEVMTGRHFLRTDFLGESLLRSPRDLALRVVRRMRSFRRERLDDDIKDMIAKYKDFQKATDLLAYIDENYPWVAQAKTVADLDKQL